MLVAQEKIELFPTDVFESETVEKLDIQASVDGFFLNLKSQLTRKSYESSCRDFFRFLGPSLCSFHGLNRNHLISYQDHLIVKGLAHKTVLKKMAGISSLCKHLAHDGFVQKDLCYGINKPRSQNKKETADFSDDEVKQIFEALNPKSKSFTSHRAMLAVGFYTGLRSKEIRTLKVSNLGVDRGHKILRLKIKGDKTHEVALTPFVYHCISEHLDFLETIGADVNSPDQWIFPGLRPFNNRAISSKSLEKVIKKTIEKAGIEKSTFKRYSPHSMRATLAGHLLNTIEAPLDQVQKTLGHSSPTTTQQYNKRGKSHDKSPLYRVIY